jgi:hypothetical protein
MKKSMVSEYQSVFNQEHIESEDWNMPSDSVWTNIEQEIKKEKKKREFFWYWLPVALLLGGLAMFWKKVSTTKTNLTATSFAIAKEEKNITENVNNNNKKLQVAVNQEIAKEKVKYKPEYIPTILNKNVSQKNNFLLKKTENLVREEIKHNVQESIPAAETQIVDTSNNGNGNNIKNKEIREAVHVDKLPLLPFALLPNKLSESPIFAKAIIEKKQVKCHPSILVSAFQMNVLNRVIGTVPEFNGESLQSARGFSIALQQKITKRAFLEIGAQYAELNYQLKYDLGLPFNGIGETKTQNGDFANTYNGAVPTTFGELKMEMVLERKASTAVPNGETISLSAEGKEKLRFIRVPISLGYILFDNHKNLTVSAKATTTQTLNFATNTVFNAVISHHNAVDETITDVQQSPKPKRWTPEIGGGFMLHYRLLPRVQIGAEGFVSQAIRPIYQNISYKNIPLFYGFGVNASYKF